MKNILQKGTTIVLFIGIITIVYSCMNEKESTLPLLTTANVSEINQTSAVSGGNITTDGGASVTASGVCWGTSQNPTITGSHTSDGTGTGIFTRSISGLTAGTLYYVRAYATNSVGTAYGNEVSFTTTSGSLATLTTTAVSDITETTSVSGGNITNDNGNDITDRGVCWATTQNPTIANSHTSEGTGTGIFTSNLTSLTSSTTYYVRAYAKSSAGTAYGNQVTFTTVSGNGLYEVLIQGMAFSPSSITVVAGTTITWTNKDAVTHTVTSNTGLFDSGNIGTDGTYSFTFPTAGTYSYYCTFHPSMTGTVVVN